MLFWARRLWRMSLNKKKKTLLSSLVIAGLVYIVVQTVFYQQTYSPLRVLPNAESEAKRLLKFITVAHYQCNNTLRSGNLSAWVICTDPDAGVDVESSQTKLAYSIGPMWDFGFEQMLATNFSFEQYIFTHTAIPLQLKSLNRTHIYRTIIVPNDPADFARNSLETQTLNNVMESLEHKQVEIIKLESLMDVANAHEVLYYMVKDGLLTSVRQLHLVLDVDKIDDDYLYRWYKTLYVLFHEAGFRLFHTSASDPLCLQVTMMESCRYYLSWLRNPGPQTFIYYPPAIDGSLEYEEERLEDYLEESKPSCKKNIPLPLSPLHQLHICGALLDKYPEKKCKLYLFGHLDLGKTEVLLGQHPCSLQVFVPHPHPDGTVRFLSKNGRSRNTQGLVEVLRKHLKSSQVNLLYLAHSTQFWRVVSPLLDSGVLQMVDQLTADFELMGPGEERSSAVLRRKYSELKRIEAYHLLPYYSSHLTSSQLHFQPQALDSQDEMAGHHVSYVRASPQL